MERERALAMLRAHEQEFLLSAVADVSLFGSVARGQNSTHEPLVIPSVVCQKSCNVVRG